MGYRILIGALSLVLAFDLALLLATTDESFGSFDPLHPATLLPIVAHRMYKLTTSARDLVGDRVAWFTAPFREHLQRTLPAEPAPQ